MPAVSPNSLLKTASSRTENRGSFNWRYDCGLELRSQLLLFKRIPLIVRVGYAKQNGYDESNTYFEVDVSDVSDLL